MREIQLTRMQVALVDDEDYEWLNKRKWQDFWNKNNASYCAIRSDWKDGRKSTVYMHRLIMNTPNDLLCDQV